MYQRGVAELNITVIYNKGISLGAVKDDCIRVIGTTGKSATIIADSIEKVECSNLGQPVVTTEETQDEAATDKPIQQEQPNTITNQNRRPNQNIFEYYLNKTGNQYTFGQTETTTPNSIIESSKAVPSKAFLFVNSNVDWSATILDSQGDSFTQDGSGDSSIEFECAPGFMSIYSLSVQKQTETGFLSIAIIQNGNILDKGETNAAYGIASLSGNCNEPG